MIEKIRKISFKEDITIKINEIKHVISSLKMLLFEMDFNGKIVNLNDFASLSLGYSYDELKGKNWFDLFCPDAKDAKIREFKEKTFGLGGISFDEFENEIVCGDSVKRVFRWKLIIDGKGSEKTVLSFGEDVTKNRLSEKIFKMLAERKPLQALEVILPTLREYFHFDRVSIGVVNTGNSFRLVSQYTSKDADGSFKTMMKKIHGSAEMTELEIKKGDLVHRVLATGETGYIPEASKSAFNGDDVRAKYGWHSRLVIPLVSTDELKIFLAFSSRKSNPLNEADLKFIEKIKPSLAAVVETWHFETEMKRLTRTDLLTGIFNRQSVIETIKQEISLARRNDTVFSVSMIDLDRFKQFNDTYGHDAGDTVLKGFSKIVKNHLREYDTFGRYGGDEFIIVFPETDSKTALKVLRRLAEIVSSTEIFRGEKVGFSAGIAEFNATDDESSLLKRADVVLYESKKERENKAILAGGRLHSREYPVLFRMEPVQQKM